LQYNRSCASFGWEFVIEKMVPKACMQRFFAMIHWFGWAGVCQRRGHTLDGFAMQLWPGSAARFGWNERAPAAVLKELGAHSASLMVFD
jgi:hypothetical protein